MEGAEDWVADEAGAAWRPALGRGPSEQKGEMLGSPLRPVRMEKRADSARSPAGGGGPQGMGIRARVVLPPPVRRLGARIREEALARGSRAHQLTTTLPRVPQPLPEGAESRHGVGWRGKRLDFAPLSSIFCLMSPGPIVGEGSTSPRP